MPSKPPEMFGEFDVAAAMTPTTRYARRFTMDVSEDALANMGRQAMPHIALQIAERAVHEHAPLIQNTVSDYLADRAWAAPIIEDELRKTVRRFAFDLLTAVYKGSADGDV